MQVLWIILLSRYIRYHQVLDFDSILSDVHCPLFLHIGDFNENSAGLQIYGGPEPLPYDLKIRHITFQGSGPR